MNEERVTAPITVSGNPLMAGAIAVVAAGLAVAFALRVPESGATAAAAASSLGLLALVWGAATLDALYPRLVVDGHGVRIRFAREWIGLSWAELDGLSVRPRAGWRESRLVPQGADRAALQGLGRAAKWYAGAMDRFFGNPYSVPVGWTSRVVGGGTDLAASVAKLSGAESGAQQEQSSPRESFRGRLHDPRPVFAAGIGTLASFMDRPRGVVNAPISLGANALDLSVSPDTQPLALPEIEQLRRPEPELADVTHVISLPTPPIDHASGEQRIGTVVAKARLRLSLSVDQLSERTRIRPHVIESIESDEFGPCGGDFYARGHLRTLCRVLGIDAAPLLTAYNDGFAQSEINARQVFQADLGRQGSLQNTRGGTQWSVVVAAVMALILAWSVARLLIDTPIEIHQPAPILNGSAGPNNATAPTASPVPVSLSAARGVRVVIRDGSGEVVFRGNLAIGETKSLDVVPPVRMSATDGSAVTLSIDGTPKGTLGTTNRPATGTFLAPMESATR